MGCGGPLRCARRDRVVAHSHRARSIRLRELGAACSHRRRFDPWLWVDRPADRDEAVGEPDRLGGVRARDRRWDHISPDRSQHGGRQPWVTARAQPRPLERYQLAGVGLTRLLVPVALPDRAPAVAPLAPIRLVARPISTAVLDRGDLGTPGHEPRRPGTQSILHDRWRGRRFLEPPSERPEHPRGAASHRRATRRDRALPAFPGRRTPAAQVAGVLGGALHRSDHPQRGRAESSHDRTFESFNHRSADHRRDSHLSVPPL